MTRTKTILRSQWPTLMSTPIDAAVLIQRVAQQRELLSELEALTLEIIESELRPATGPKRKTPATE